MKDGASIIDVFVLLHQSLSSTSIIIFSRRCFFFFLVFLSAGTIAEQRTPSWDTVFFYKRKYHGDRSAHLPQSGQKANRRRGRDATAIQRWSSCDVFLFLASSLFSFGMWAIISLCVDVDRFILQSGNDCVYE